MNIKQENKLSMFFAVAAVLQKHFGVWSVLVAFADGFQRFAAAMMAIETHRIAQELDRRGVRKDKHVARREMMEKGMVVSKAVVAFATVNRDETLAEKMNLTESDFMGGRDTAALDLGKMVLQETTIVLSQLGNYGITGQTLGELSALINEYESWMGLTRAGSVEASAAGDEMERQFDIADDILKLELDGLVRQFKGQAFFDEYWGSREIIDN